MWPEAVEARWRELSEEVFVGMKEWRIQHPKATFREIEAALDERLGRVRARMLEDAALATAATDFGGSETERPCCPTCGGRLEGRAAETRSLTVQHEQTVRLTRRYAECPACGAGLFPPGRGTRAGAGESRTEPV